MGLIHVIELSILGFKMAILTCYCIMSQNGQTHFKNLAAFADFNIGQFPQKSCFSANRQFEPNLGQNYATLYRRQLSLMICSLGFLKCCCVIQYLD